MPMTVSRYRGDGELSTASTVTFTDGSTTVAEDTSFAIGAADVLGEDDSITLPAAKPRSLKLMRLSPTLEPLAATASWMRP